MIPTTSASCPVKIPVTEEHKCCLPTDTNKGQKLQKEESSLINLPYMQPVQLDVRHIVTIPITPVCQMQSVASHSSKRDREDTSVCIVR